jgi:hypothetical protein
VKAMYRRPVGRVCAPTFVRTRGGTTTRPRGGHFRTTYRQPPQDEIYEEDGDESYEHDEFGNYMYERPQYEPVDYEDNDGDEYVDDEQVEEEEDDEMEEEDEDVSLRFLNREIVLFFQ